MKKLVHLGIAAIFVISVSSCSKSGNDLISNEKSAKSKLASLNPGMQPASAGKFAEGKSKFFTYVNEPVETKLGDPDSYLPIGKFAVFYVVLANDFAAELPSEAMLVTMDDKSGDIIQGYNLFSSEDAAAYGVKVPEELNDSRFMFAIVELDDQYTERSIGLHSEITVGGITSVAQLDHAFVGVEK